ncbi:MAG: biotin/lipoyl-binding protein [Myxococcales bacterium]|nr:biotin/lipoyl-binding protein [Myxococcales bacterium]MCB9644260.1 biotin/lipoyl-binding protein [Myxococcales bacterium]
MLNLDVPKEQKDELRLSRQTSVAIDGRLHQVRFTPLRATRQTQSAANAAEGEGSITAFMPGTIVRVMVEEGQKVVMGDVLLILEAMKMENEVKAPHDGVVKTVAVSAGANVNKGQMLVEIEAPSSEASAET